MTKKALVVGINDYTIQSQHDQNLYQLSWPTLRCCINDADSIYHLLIQAFSFDSEDVILLKDAQATRRNILSALGYLLGNTNPGDVICFYFAGHGGLLPATTAPDNTRFYEAIIPYQGDWIYDYRLEQLTSGLDSTTVNFTVILDSCHAGGLYPTNALAEYLPRTVPFRPSVAATIQNLQTYWPFGICLPSGSTELIPNVRQVQVEGNRLVTLAEDPTKLFVPSARATLLAACHYYELAGEDPRYRHGYLTQALLDIVTSSDFRMSYAMLHEQVVARVRALSGHTQTPQLRGLPNRMNENFLQGWNHSI